MVIVLITGYEMSIVLPHKFLSCFRVSFFFPFKLLMWCKLTIILSSKFQIIFPCKCFQCVISTLLFFLISSCLFFFCVFIDLVTEMITRYKFAHLYLKSSNRGVGLYLTKDMGVITPICDEFFMVSRKIKIGKFIFHSF